MITATKVFPSLETRELEENAQQDGKKSSKKMFGLFLVPHSVNYLVW